MRRQMLLRSIYKLYGSIYYSLTFDCHAEYNEGCCSALDSSLTLRMTALGRGYAMVLYYCSKAGLRQKKSSPLTICCSGCYSGLARRLAKSSYSGCSTGGAGGGPASPEMLASGAISRPTLGSAVPGGGVLLSPSGEEHAANATRKNTGANLMIKFIYFFLN